jgi:hypothetical protein
MVYFAKNSLVLRLKEEIFYQTDGGNFLMVALPYLSHWLPSLSSQFHEGTH